MPAMTNPMNALDSMQRILFSDKSKAEMRPCELNKSFSLHIDNPNGTQRRSYFNLHGSLVKAVCIFTPVDPLDGKPCFGVGYAVAPRYRKNGLGKEIITIGINEMKNGLQRNGIPQFYIEAVIGTDNIASQKVAEQTISKEKKECIDDQSGANAYVYRRLIS